MSSQTTNTPLELLIFLLPGFVAAAIFYSLTSHPKPDSLERTILALIFTLIIQSIVQIVQAVFSFTEFTQPEPYSLAIVVIVAIGVGVIAAICINHDFPHRVLRKFKITKENSYPSEWYSAFSQREESYVVLYLYDGRSVYGWPTEWPSKPAEGHFRLEDAEWMKISTDNNDSESVKSLLVPVIDVQIVEFVPISK